jgi:hypothetical protein
VIAYKFLAAGSLGPLTGFAWPPPGVWVEAAGPLAPCARGVHVCRPSELAHWLSDELWEVEAGGAELAGVDCVVVERARLVRRIAAWTDGGAERFAAACVAHVSERVPAPAGELRELLDDARLCASGGYPAIGAYGAALVVARASADPEQAYAEERAWQSLWIARELIG